LVDNHNCRFGLWYDSGDGHKSYNHLPVYGSIIEPHSMVHKTVHDIINEIRNPDWQQSEASHAEIIRGFTQAEAASAALIDAVDKMAEEKKKFEGNTGESECGEIDLF